MKTTSTPTWRHAVASASLMLLSACGGSGSTTLIGTTAGTTNGATSLLVTSIASVNAVINSGVVSTSVDFNSSESTPITNLKVTGGLSSLAAGWSGPASFSCASVSSGNGCVLNLSYAPTAIEKGTLTISFSYTDSTGTAQTGSTAIDYRGTTNNNVVGTVSPAGQVVAIVGSGSQTVTVTFDTDDGNLASAFSVTTALTSLPIGWRGAVNTLSCASVSTGTTCQLRLSFVPTAVASGTLSLAYRYTDDFGTAKTGAVSIPYAATVHDNVVGTPAPGSPLYSIVGNAPLPVAVTFTTDDGNTATALTLTSSLSALPAGWTSSATSFTCTTISTGSACQLPLVFTAGIGASGTLPLTYSYTDNAGTAKTGSVNIAYTSATHDNVVGTPSPAGTVRVQVGNTASVSVTFDTDDGNTATALVVTSDLSALPAGWSGTGSFTCASVSTGSGCRLTLAYAPITNAAGSITLNFSYLDSSGTAKTGTVILPYSNPHLYILDYNNGAYLCPINLDNSLGTCALTATGVTEYYGTLAVSGNYAYVPNGPTNQVFVCDFNVDGTITGCLDSGVVPGPGVTSLATAGSYLYIAANNGVSYCSIGAGGVLSGCVSTASAISFANAIAFNAGIAYVTGSGGVNLCNVGGDGSLAGCVVTGDGAVLGGSTSGMSVSGSHAYITLYSPGGVNSCAIGNGGTLSGCTVYYSNLGELNFVQVNETTGYLDAGTAIYSCTVDTPTGAWSNCVVSDGGWSGYAYAISYY